MELDQNFSLILQKKREEQLEASRQKLYESNLSKLTESTIEHETTDNKNDIISKEIPVKASADLENSMFFVRGNKSFNETSGTDDSFLELERQCNLEDKKEQLLNANDTLLFDVEPPTDLWNQTVNQTSMMPILETSQQSDDSEIEESIEIPPIKYIGMIRPSTIIEETSSQMESSSKNNSSLQSKSSSISTNDATNESFKSFESSTNNSDLTMSDQNTSKSKRFARQSRRETFAFKRRNYTFFPDENLDPINESNVSNAENSTANEISANESMVESSQTPKVGGDQFNDTLEAMDYFLEKGRQLIEQTPVAKRDNLQRSVMETPLFSCKRKRMLDEMASVEMMPLPKRGPLIDFSTPEPIIQPRTGTFFEK